MSTVYGFSGPCSGCPNWFTREDLACAAAREEAAHLDEHISVEVKRVKIKKGAHAALHAALMNGYVDECADDVSVVYSVSWGQLSRDERRAMLAKRSSRFGGPPIPQTNA